MDLDELKSAGLRRRAGAPRGRKAVLRTTLLTLGLLLGAAAAHAADACFLDDLGDIAVFKSFRVPRPGDCKPLTGHQHQSYITLTGTVCGTSAGGHLTFNFTYIGAGDQFGFARWHIARVNFAGAAHSCDGRVDGGPWGCSTVNVRKVPCPAPPIHY
jgi:hypothetical protein